MKKSFSLIAIAALLLLSCSLALGGPSEQTSSAFESFLIVTERGTTLEALGTNSPAPEAGVGGREFHPGQRFFLLTAFRNCMPDSLGICNVTASYQVQNPEGALILNTPAEEIGRQRPTGDVTLGAHYLMFAMNPEEPLGRYLVNATVMDANSSASVTSSLSFVITNAPVPVGYKPGRTFSQEELGRWIANYYKNPEPEVLPDAIVSFYRTGQEMEGAIITFTSQVFRHNPGRVGVWMEAMSVLPDYVLRGLYGALWLADTEETRALLRKYAPEPEVYEARTPPVIEEMEFLSPAVLDMLWAAYYATGREVYVLRVVEALGIKDKGVAGMLLAGAARWSLLSNALQDDRVYEICKAAAKSEPEQIAGILEGMLKDLDKEREKRKSGARE